jgi:tRNA pseudouridine55 synthase
MKVYKVNKKIGETPLEALEKFRKKQKISPSAKLTYAGRLDPMASGVLLILQDATQKQREKYMGLDKEYEVEVLFGFETDTYDLLGLPVLPSRVHPRDPSLSRDGLEKIIKKYLGVSKLKVPPYSSIPYKGKPLFEWAKAGKKVKLPLREMEVISLRQGFGRPSESVKLKEKRYITSAQLLKYIQINVKKVKGDFRQEKILKAWEKMLLKPSTRVIPASEPGSRINKKLDSRFRGNNKNSNLKFKIIKFKISVGSGTYIRSIAHDLGKKLKTGGVVFSLKRTRVGKYKV